MKFKDVYLDDRRLTRTGIADNYFLRLRGLIGRDPAQLGGLWIKPCSQIHTFFMSCPIDVVYLSRDMRVLQIDTAVPKGKVCRAVKHAHSVLELPAGRAEALSIPVDAFLTLRESSDRKSGKSKK